MDKFAGIKNAVGVAKRWEAQDNRYRAHIMVDLSDNTVWCDTFTSCNSWASYTSNTVHSITDILGSVLQIPISIKNIQKAIDYILEEERRKASERES